MDGGDEPEDAPVPGPALDGFPQPGADAEAAAVRGDDDVDLRAGDREEDLVRLIPDRLRTRARRAPGVRPPRARIPGIFEVDEIR